jgi:hypothetical protein
VFEGFVTDPIKAENFIGSSRINVLDKMNSR